MIKKPKTIKELYLDQPLFPEMNGVVATGSLNRCDTQRKVGEKGTSYMSDGGNPLYNTPKFVPPSPKRIRDMEKQRVL